MYTPNLKPAGATLAAKRTTARSQRASRRASIKQGEEFKRQAMEAAKEEAYAIMTSRKRLAGGSNHSVYDDRLFQSFQNLSQDRQFSVRVKTRAGQAATSSMKQAMATGMSPSNSKAVADDAATSCGLEHYPSNWLPLHGSFIKQKVYYYYANVKAHFTPSIFGSPQCVRDVVVQSLNSERQLILVDGDGKTSCLLHLASIPKGASFGKAQDMFLQGKDFDDIYRYVLGLSNVITSEVLHLLLQFLVRDWRNPLDQYVVISPTSEGGHRIQCFQEIDAALACVPCLEPTLAKDVYVYVQHKLITDTYMWIPLCYSLPAAFVPIGVCHFTRTRNSAFHLFQQEKIPLDSDVLCYPIKASKFGIVAKLREMNIMNDNLVLRPFTCTPSMFRESALGLPQIFNTLSDFSSAAALAIWENVITLFTKKHSLYCTSETLIFNVHKFVTLFGAMEVCLFQGFFRACAAYLDESVLLPLWTHINQKGMRPHSFFLVSRLGYEPIFVRELPAWRINDTEDVLLNIPWTLEGNVLLTANHKILKNSCKYVALRRLYRLDSLTQRTSGDNDDEGDTSDDSDSYSTASYECNSDVASTGTVSGEEEDSKQVRSRAVKSSLVPMVSKDGSLVGNLRKYDESSLPVGAQEVFIDFTKEDCFSLSSSQRDSYSRVQSEIMKQEEEEENQQSDNSE